ncbi:hypothetical protein Glove_543g75 [Diversispora epigaea]|uniref:Uncharacterized protein n=1 Tax=Diversispora epigaea TaxID=1348612 RepID=A0A397GCM8_9GLOM|nr:hypothetical protein Glove_543g75 [Diversispora epigaea]
MTKITSVLAAVGLVFSCLGLIAQAEHDLPTSVGNPVFPSGLVIPPEIEADKKNKFAFSLFGPVGILVNDCKDFNEIIVEPRFVTAVSLDNPQASNTLVSAGFRSAFPGDISTSLFTVEATAPAPNSGDAAWLRSKAFNQTGTGAFSDVTYLQRVYTTGELNAVPPTPMDMSILHVSALHCYSTRRMVIIYRM